MSHPDLDRLTAWVHGLLEPGEAEAIGGHVAGCPDCRESVDDVGEEARLLAREILAPARAEALKERILEAAGRRRFRWSSALWQIPAAAALLLGLLAVLFSRGQKHRLEDGRVSLQDGSVAVAPLDLDGSRAWQMRALEQARVRLADLTTVELGTGTRIALTAEGSRGVRPAVASGEAKFVVARGADPLTIEVPAGHVDSADGTLVVKLVAQEKGEVSMNKPLAGALITLVAGSASLFTPSGVADARIGQPAVLAPAEPPLLVASPQDKQEDLLRRLEQLVERVTKLEAEVSQLEAKNKQLKLQLQASAPGMPGASVWSFSGGEGVIVNPGPGSSAQVLHVQIEEKDEKKPERKNAPSEK